MKPWKAIWAALIIFCAGAVSGSLATKLYLNSLRTSGKGPAPSDFGFSQRSDYVHRLERQLGLTPDQSQRIEKIVRESQERMKKLWQPIAPQAQAQFQHTRDRIREVLTPEQRVKFDALSKSRQRRKPEDAASGWESKREHRKPPAADPGQPTNRPTPAPETVESGKKP